MTAAFDGPSNLEEPSSSDADLIEAFSQAQRRRNFSARTIHCRRAVLARLSQHVALSAATKPDIEAFLDTLDLGAQGRYTYIAHLHAFYNWAVRAEVLSTDPTATIDRPRLPKRLPKPIPQDELDRALEGADPRMTAWLLLGALAGFRISDMAGLRRCDIDETATPATITVAQGKGQKDRVMPLHPRAGAALVAFGLPDAGLVFTDTDGSGLAPNTIGVAIATHLRRCGANRSAHSLRHAFGSAVYRATRDLVLTAQLMGHSSVTTTMGYVKINPDEAGTAAVFGL